MPLLGNRNQIGYAGTDIRMKSSAARLLAVSILKPSASDKTHHGIRAFFILISLPFLTQCSFTGDWLPDADKQEQLTLRNVRLETPAAISPDFQLSTPEAIAPEIELAMLPEDNGTSNPVDNTLDINPQNTPGPSETSTASATVTTTITLTGTATASPTASSTPMTIWPTWTSAPTRTHTASPTPSKTNVPATQPPSAPTATVVPSKTTEPGGDPPPEPTATYTPVPTNTPLPTDTPGSSSCSPAGNSSYEATLIGLINDARQAQGLPPLSQQSQLTAAARVHSNDMACNDFISHTGSDGSRPADRVTAQGYSYSWVGENIFAGSSSPQTAFEWWMNSDPHRDNILHSSYTEIGIGYSYLEGSRYRSHYTAVFARPR